MKDFSPSIIIVALLAMAVIGGSGAAIIQSGNNSTVTPPKTGNTTINPNKTNPNPNSNAQTNVQLQLQTFSPTPMPAPLITNCKLPTLGIDEPYILYAVQTKPTVALGGQIGLEVYYSDERKLVLGVLPATGPLNISRMKTNSFTDHVINPGVGDTTAVDLNKFPYYPAAFITDITSSPNSTVGDAQNGGIVNPPNAVYGSWTYFFPNITSIDGDQGVPGQGPPTAGFPPFNDLNIDGGDVFPAVRNGPQGASTYSATPPTNGFTAEIVWDLTKLVDQTKTVLKSGHKYRIQIALHDSDNGSNTSQTCTEYSMP